MAAVEVLRVIGYWNYYQIWAHINTFQFNLIPGELRPNAGHDLLIIEVSRSHSLDAPQSVGLLWTSDQPVAETSAWQHTTLTTNTHALGAIRTHNLSKRAAANLRLRPHGHWDWHINTLASWNSSFQLRIFGWFWMNSWNACKMTNHNYSALTQPKFILIQLVTVITCMLHVSICS
jgi:hypothetical protein